MKSDYNEYPCDICGSGDAAEVPYVRLYTGDQPIHICQNCGFVYVKYRRGVEEVAKAWDDIYSGSEGISDSYLPRIPAVVARHTYVAEFIDMHLGLKSKKVIDIGAGEGQFLKQVQAHFEGNVFGIEPFKNNCDLMDKNGVANFCGTIESFTDAGVEKKADVATILWTLENCSSCESMIKSVRNLLVDDGHIVVATGSRILVPFKKPLKEYFGKNPVDTHCFRFSANTLCALLAKCGFETAYINRYIDTDYLCVIGKKRPEQDEIKWQGDNFFSVYDFFERWHKESIYYE
jgi:ubiquinone/menaquinone biosynthesis C-methylase UbiE